jgi:hypothetical protein
MQIGSRTIPDSSGVHQGPASMYVNSRLPVSEQAQYQCTKAEDKPPSGIRLKYAAIVLQLVSLEPKHRPRAA